MKMCNFNRPFLIAVVMGLGIGGGLTQPAGAQAQSAATNDSLIPKRPEELQKVKNEFSAGEYRRLTANTPILMELLQYEGEGDWHEINDEGAKIQAVTAADIQRVATTYFTRENCVTGIYKRKGNTPNPPKAMHE